MYNSDFLRDPNELYDFGTYLQMFLEQLRLKQQKDNTEEEKLAAKPAWKFTDQWEAENKTAAATAEPEPEDELEKGDDKPEDGDSQENDADGETSYEQLLDEVFDENEDLRSFLTQMDLPLTYQEIVIAAREANTAPGGTLPNEEFSHPDFFRRILYLVKEFNARKASNKDSELLEVPGRMQPMFRSLSETMPRHQDREEGGIRQIMDSPVMDDEKNFQAFGDYLNLVLQLLQYA